MRRTDRRAVVNGPPAALVAALLCALAGGADAEQITLRLHTFNSPRSIAVQLFLEPWAEEVEARSEGRVEVQVFPAMQLGGRPADLYGQARDGVVDIIWTLPGYSAGRFPLTEVFELPFVCGDAEATSQALHEFYGKWLRDEYDDTHPLVFHAAAPGHIHTAGREVRTLEDLQALKIRAPSRISAEMLEALGAVPIGMPVPRVYEALSRGVVEGALIPWTIMRPFRLHEVTQYHTEVSFSCALFLMTMNKARYDGLPAEIRAIIDETTGIALARRLGRLWQDDEQPGRAIALERGHSIIPLPEAERERWRTVLQPVTDGWVEQVSAMGHDGEAMLADARRLVAEYGDDLHR
ncbi:MAG: TRAP transporter substrate-binding protein [Gammaproteobacteria bacterium]|nr:TRAP transporter substrate-binding protein [Gammaproteobacteria bacterium]